MAKQRRRGTQSYYQAPNTALIRGAAAVSASENQPMGGINFSDQFSSLSRSVARSQNYNTRKREAAQKEANEAYSALSSMNFEGILPGMYDGVQQSLMPMAQEIAELKLEASQISDPEEKALINSEINKRDALIKRFTTQVKDLSTSALDQLDYNRSDDRSEANDEDYVSSINKIFSGQAEPLMIDGELAFNINGEIQKYSSLKNVSPKAYDEFTAYSDAVGTATRAREPIPQERADAFKSKMFSTITPDNIVSFGMDNFGTGKRLLGDQFETIQDWQAFVEKDYNGAKQLLADRLAENYINTYNNSAAEYKRKNPPRGYSRGRGNGIQRNQYLNTDAQRLFQAISGSGGQAFAIETGDNFILPNNPAGAKYKVSWGNNQVTFKATGGRKLIDPITGRQATSTTISLPELANFYGVDYSGDNFPGQIQSADAESTILNPEVAQKVDQQKPQF